MPEMSLKRMQNVIQAEVLGHCKDRHPAYGTCCILPEGHVSSHRGHRRENSVTSANEAVRWENVR